MSDFNHAFWSVAVAAATLVGIIACLILLWLTSRKKIPATADNTTGHVWDGDLTEMNNPMPMWWVWLFIGTIVFSLLYLIAYPGLGAYEGELKWTQKQEYQAEMAKADAALAPLYAQFTARKPEELAGDPAAMAIGERLFMNNCAQCHGSDARGSKGFPNLADADWLYGGMPAQIAETITKGRTIRCARSWARASSAPAPPAMAPPARATRRWARPTWPTTSGCTAGASKPSSTS